MSLLFFTLSFTAVSVFNTKNKSSSVKEAKAHHEIKINCREKVNIQQDQIITSLKRIENQIQ